MNPSINRNVRTVPEQKQSRWLLYAAFGGVLGLFVLTMLSGSYYAYQTNARLEAITNTLNVKDELVDTMYTAARERSLLLYAMLLNGDPFVRDQMHLEFNDHGSHFARARLKLLTMVLSQDEKSILDQQSVITRKNVPLQLQIVDLILNGKLERAHRLLTEEAVPQQNRVLSLLSRLKTIQQKKIDELVNIARQSRQQTLLIIGLFGSLAIALSLFIAWYIIGRISRMENNLFMEKRLAQITLDSIGDAVLTTDRHGRITSFNHMAEQITACTANEAIGIPIEKIFCVFSESDRKHLLHPVDTVLSERRVLNSRPDVILKRRDNSELAIEYTISPIRDEHNDLHGAVLVFRDVTEMRSLSSMLTYQASHDPLTGLVNRREFESRVNQAIASAKQSKTIHALCFMDLDQLKFINDSAGHKAGDELLKQVANRLAPELRRNDVLARIGGDEFGVLLEDCDEANAVAIAEKLRMTIKDSRFAWGNNAFDISISIGLVMINEETTDTSSILGAADTACLLAKERGRNRVEVYQAGSMELINRRREMHQIRGITQAIEQDRLVLYCQHIVPLSRATDRRPFCEVLVRMLDDDGKIIPPMSFIPAGERFNLMPELDKWVIKKVLEIYENNTGTESSLVSINLSGQSISNKFFVDFVCNIIRDSRIQPDMLCFEITETAAIANMSTAMKFIERLRDMGCKFALDDFGSGLSSFSYLKKMPVDFLKIDGSFVRDICHDPIDLAFVESIHRIGEMMNIETIAEYVESEEIRQKVDEIGITYGQGFYFNRPEPIGDR